MKNGYLFSVDVFIEGETNGVALEKLIQLLNTEDVIDYRVNKGINLGQVIEAAVQLSEQNKAAGNPPAKPVPSKTAAEKQQQSASSSPAAAAPKKEAKKAATPSAKLDFTPIIEQIEQFKEKNTLVRLSILKGKGVTLNLPCRILNFDLNSGNITVYHVDEKKVYSFQINEIEDLQG